MIEASDLLAQLDATLSAEATSYKAKLKLIQYEFDFEKTREETEGLSIQLKCAETDVSERDMVVIMKSAALEVWSKVFNIIKESLVGVVDKVLECREFRYGVIKLKDACLTAREAADWGHAKEDHRLGSH
ncbi:hypothetical protein L1887_23712 [Cichorium endivia]|nr:hypothetical protein L1887_23712 [Cichorium endivia]